MRDLGWWLVTVGSGPRASAEAFADYQRADAYAHRRAAKNTDVTLARVRHGSPEHVQKVWKRGVVVMDKTSRPTR